MKQIFFSATFLIVFFTAIGQPCLTDYKYLQYQKQHPELQSHFDAFNNLPSDPSQHKTNGAVRIIPVVFHVIHQYGPENISKAQIDSAIKFLNEDYRKQNPDTINIRSVFKPFAADCEIEFRLARLDPNGNCTEGIERIYSPLTVEADDNVKDLSAWDNTMYLNIWVVKSISMNGFNLSGTILGYATFPTGGFSPSDGVVIRNDCLGRIGTEQTSPFAKKNRVLTHEVGHWLGLYHTFQGGCFGGDQVNDTPPVDSANYGCTMGHNSCTNFTAPYTTDPPDMLENYMDYTGGYCQTMFSAGQKARIDASISTYRSRIYSAANLISTGVNLTGASTCVPVADFISDKTVACTGVPFSFTDLSYNGNITKWEWTFNGAAVNTSTAENPTGIIWNTPGKYTISLKVTTVGGNNSLFRNSYIEIIPAIAPDKIPMLEGFENTDITQDGWAIENGGDITTWTRTTAVKHSGNACFKIDNYGGTVSGDIDAFYSKSYNLSTAISPKIYFYTAYAQSDETINDGLKMYISTDCGQTWQTKLSMFGKSLAGGVPVYAGSYVPKATDWVAHVYDLNEYAGVPNVRFRFESVSRAGNVLYIDDINVIDSYTGIVDPSLNEVHLQLTPNPTSAQSLLTFYLNQTSRVCIKVRDVLGKEINITETKEINAGKVSITIDENAIQNLCGNIYFVEVEIDGVKHTTKLLKL